MSEKNDIKLMGILVVTYDYFPDTSPNTYRWHNILKEWAARGHKIFVISAQKPGFSQFESVDGIQIYRTGQSWLERLKSRLPKTVQESKKRDSKSPQVLTKESLIKRLYNLTFKKIYFPDFAFLWFSPGKKLASKIIQEHNVQNLITVSWPFTDHLIGYHLKNKFKVNWIADTIDPFYLSDAVNNNYFYKNANYQLENKVLSSASHVTVLTDKLKEKYTELYPSLRNKITVNHNIFIPYEKSEYIFESTNKIKLVFFGTLTPKTRSPHTLLKIMDLIDRTENTSMIELHIYGDTTQCDAIFRNFKHLIGRKVYVHGLITKEQVKNYSKSANVLVNIGNSNEYQEPSKLIEYIFLNKPILNICSIINDSSKELLDQYPINLNFYKEDLQDKLKIRDLFDFISSKTNIRNAETNNMKLIENYLLPEVQSRYFNLLEDGRL